MVSTVRTFDCVVLSCMSRVLWILFHRDDTEAGPYCSIQDLVAVLITTLRQALLAMRQENIHIKVLTSVAGANVCTNVATTPLRDARCAQQRVHARSTAIERAIDLRRRPGCMHDTEYDVYGNEGCSTHWYPQATPICIWVPLSRSHRDRACCSCDSRRCMLRITRNHRNKLDSPVLLSPEH
jgi:hypothetical protein